MEHYLDTVRNFGPQSDGFHFGFLVEAIHATIFISLTLLFLAIERIPYFDKYRLRPKVAQDPRLTKETIKNILFSHLVAPVYLRFVVWPVFQLFGGMALTGPLPAWHIIALQIVGSMLLEDTLFYWTHRLLHHPLLYKHFHKQHHQYKFTVSYAAEYANPVDQTISNVMPTYAGPILFHMHVGVLALWLFLRLWETFESHSGYVFPWSPWNAMLSIQGGAARHDYHHSHNAGSYGSLFTFWDWAMGTDVPFKQFQKKERELQAKKLSE